MSDSPLSPAPPSLTQMLVGIPQVSSAQWQQMSVVTRWLVATRASVLPMTLFSVIFAGVLNTPGVTATGWLLWFGCAVGLTLAHATNNLLNDYVDFRGGLDTGNYFRTRYGVHPLAAGLLSAPRYRLYIATNRCQCPAVCAGAEHCRRRHNNDFRCGRRRACAVLHLPSQTHCAG